MNAKEFFNKKIKFDKRRLGIFSRLLVNTTLNFFIAVVVFSVASFILLPQIFIHQEKEIESLRREIRSLNGELSNMRSKEEGAADSKNSDSPAVSSPALPAGDGVLDEKSAEEISAGKDGDASQTSPVKKAVSEESSSPETAAKLSQKTESDSESQRKDAGTGRSAEAAVEN